MLKTLTLTSLALLVAAPRAEETLALTVEEGTSLTKTFTSELELELEEIEVTLTVDGEEQDIAAPDVEVTITEYEEVTVTDEYLSVADGVATKVARHYDALTDRSSQEMTDPEGESSDETKEGTSGLEGRTVVHSWDADVEEWSMEYAEGDEDGDTDLLDELEQWADLTSFLPDDAVDVGDEWDVPVTAFLHLSSPCGDLQFVKEDEPEDPNADAFGEQFEDNLDGEIVASLESVEDGLATIALRIELTTEIEIDEELPEDAPPMEATRGMDFEFDMAGTIVWNITQGHLVSAEVTGDVALEVTNRQEGDQGVTVVFEQVQRFAGTLTLGAEVE